ncbi:hypothetical protein [Calidifontibacillus oryziterrae]|uniref:hypothetical protein n=1 Tax=Calidifontibacillus oryziterrae TaxID=1191699 RepID=UPI0002D87DCD|nr:hypothetical protein [Calidifontibacillus oryziterrae]
MNALLVLVILIIIAIIFSSATKSASYKMILFTGKIIDYVLIVYVALLFVGSIAYVGLAMKADSMNSQRAANEEIKKAFEAADNFYRYLEEGKLAEAEGVYVNEKWQFPYEDNRLAITSSPLSGNQPRVIVERMYEAAGNQQIEVVQYMTKSIIDGFDYSDYVKPPKITVDYQRMKIEQPDRTEIKHAKITKEFTINQFTAERYNTDRFFDGVNIARGENVLYLRVPASIEVVEGKGVALQFVESVD